MHILAVLLFLNLCLDDVNASLNVTFPSCSLTRTGNHSYIELSKSVNKSIYFAEKNDGGSVIIKCDANYPITFIFDGIINPLDIINLLRPSWNYTSQMYQIQVVIELNLYDKTGQHIENEVAADIICVKVDNHFIHNTISIFIPGTLPRIGAKVKAVTNSNLIPCYTTDPKSHPKLFKSTGELIQNVNYSHIHGFTADSYFKGNYSCQLQVQNDTEVVKIEAFVEDFEISPKSRSVYSFHDRPLELKCISWKAQPIRMVIHDPKYELKVVFKTDKKTAQVAEVSYRDYDKPQDIGFYRAFTVNCIEIKNGSKVWTWRLKFRLSSDIVLLAPRYPRLDELRRIDCVSYDTNFVSMETVFCHHSFECQFVMKCLSTLTNCNLGERYKYTVPIQSAANSIYSISSPYSQLTSNGIVNCKLENGLSKMWEYFVALDSHTYLNWRMVPQNGLIRMDDVPEILYGSSSNQFICRALAYMFVDKLEFHVQFENGSYHIVTESDEFGIVTNTQVSHPLFWEIIGVLDIYLPQNVIGVSCNAILWNSTEMVIVYKNFETIFPPPTIEYSNKTTTISFYEGELNATLDCKGSGKPRANYQWLYRTNSKAEFVNVSEIFDGTKVIESKDDTSLIFPKTIESHSGEYKCVLENSLGKAEKFFVLEVKENPAASRLEMAIILIVTVVSFVLLVFAFLALGKKYWNAKTRLRDLTEDEIKEFFEGNAFQLNDTGMKELQEYEIAFDDIEFGNYLGAGEFSYVSKAIIISKDKEVAVKITKPRIDVGLFKSLLSEVKIMAYVGEHENIVLLVGVCTENIRKKSIYIATDICELGDLEKFLHKSRKSFVNLIDKNQKMDYSLVYKTDFHDSISTLDLISFSAQIANGMDYLANKAVVHADLATRNVLLTNKKIAKICDFGLSRKLYGDDIYFKKTKTRLPWRWMAPESLTAKAFSTPSDVWSYGVTLYEIFTLGDKPFPKESWTDDFVTRLSEGMRLDRPQYSTQEIFNKISTCWEKEPAERPDFTSLSIFFNKLYYSYNQEEFDNDN